MSRFPRLQEIGSAGKTPDPVLAEGKGLFSLPCFSGSMGFVYVEFEGGAKGGAVRGAVEVFFVFPWKEYHLPETELHQTKDCG